MGYLMRFMWRREKRPHAKAKPAWECDCPCHKAPLSLVHPIPCCSPCPHCGKAVANGMLAVHLKECDADRVCRNCSR